MYPPAHFCLYIVNSVCSIRIEGVTLRSGSWIAAALLMVLGLAGCGPASNLPKTVPAEGVVTLDGTPVSDVTIIFIAETGTYNATAVTDAQGKFALKAFPEKDGAVPGKYKVEMTKTIVEAASAKKDEPNVNLKYGLPKKYATYTTSGLSKDIPEAGVKDIKFELVSK